MASCEGGENAPRVITTWLMCVVLSIVLWVLVGVFVPATCEAHSPNSEVATAPKENVIIDTDIGSDIDDAFAVALALRSPELNILGFSTVSIDTTARAKIIDRLLGETGRSDIPVVAGLSTMLPGVLSPPPGYIGPQSRYGERGHYIRQSHPPAVEFILEQIRHLPSQITLVAIGPLSNVGALIDKDPETFRKLKRVVLMGGWIKPMVYLGRSLSPTPEWNIMFDVHSAQKLFESGVPIYLFPKDSTDHLALDEVRRQLIFSVGAPLTDALALLYLLSADQTPVLHDPMAVAFLLDPQLCPVKPMHIVIDERGVTRDTTGAPNAQVCLHSDANTFLDYYVRRFVDIRD